MAMQNENPEHQDYTDDVDDITKKPRVPNHILIGDEYLTVGGWKARIVHITNNRYYAYAIHKPDTKEESHPLSHEGSGVYEPFLETYSDAYNICFDKKISN